MDINYARDPKRSNSKDFIENHIQCWQTIHGDRIFGDDRSVLCGIGKLQDLTIAIIAQHPGRLPLERIENNYGMTRAYGYRKMQRMIKIAEKFKLPLLYLIDTPGADASVDSSTQNQSKAIADTIAASSQYPYASISVILNQGMSGGAIAITMADEVWMREHAIFSVISPEGCASILWRDKNLAAKASKKLKMSAQDLLEMGIIDRVVPEDLNYLREHLYDAFIILQEQTNITRLYKRYHRWDYEYTKI